MDKWNEAPSGRTADNARWLSMSDPFELLAKAISPPWDGQPLESTVTIKPVQWEEGAPSQVELEACWHHRVARCTRADGEVLIHHLSMREVVNGVPRAAFLAQLSSAARREAEQQAAAEQAPSERASNVGGFHGARDLWTRPDFVSCSAPAHFLCAVKLAAIAEGNALARAPLWCPHDDIECWFNHLPPGGWNTLHNHPGRTFSLVYFVADGKGSSEADATRRLLGGRLALLPGATTISDEQRRNHVVPKRIARQDEGEGEHGGVAEPHSSQLRYLLVDPVPGTCVIFPSFVPHFVVPIQESDANASDCQCMSSPDDSRISVACNFSGRHQ